jgi:Ca2+-binding EF-hand superfamily protein
MKRYLLMALLAAIPSVHGALADFDAIDADGDGRISAAEHGAGAKKMFQAMDQDRDDRVTAAEMSAAQRAISGAGSTSRPMSSEEKIRVVDTNGDGILSAAEHENASREMFAKMDADKDGFLSREEWAAGHAALAKKQ